MSILILSIFSIDRNYLRPIIRKRKYTMITHPEYMTIFNQTDFSKSGLQRHLDVCGINSKMNSARKAKKFLWGFGNPTNTWKTLHEIKENDPKDIHAILRYLIDLISFDEQEQKDLEWVKNVVSFVQVSN